MHLHFILQFVAFIVLVTTISVFTYNYNRYKHYNNYALILKENDFLKAEHNDLRRQFDEYDKLADKVNEYLFVLNKKDGTFNKFEKSNDKISSIKDMLKRFNEHKKYVYSFLESRRSDVASFFSKLGLSSISYDERGKSANVSNDLFSKINDAIDGNFVGGPNEPVQMIKVLKKKPLLVVSNKDINDKSFLNEIDRIIVLQKTINVLPFGSPTDGDYRITSGYGFREDPIVKNKTLSVHRGIDMVLSNKNIVATMDGVVVFAGFKNGYGNCIDIEHKTDGTMPSIVTHYAHLDKMFVSRGQFVSKGERIGIQGNTGRSTGPHLHYEVKYNNVSVNPLKFVTMKD